MSDGRAVTMPADAPVALRRRLVGPGLEGRVIAVFPHAVYVSFGGDTARGGRVPVIAIVTSDGVHQPNALVIAAPAASAPFRGLQVGAPATVGEGGVVIGHGSRPFTVRAARWSDRRPRLGSLDQARLADATRLLRAQRLADQPADLELEARVETLALALETAHLPGIVYASRRLVGLGPGLTPAGDDVLAGLLAGGRALARAGGDEALDGLLRGLWRALADDLAQRTTAISAALLAHAARGEMARPAVALTVALATDRGLDEARRDLLAVGHTSGRDLARGLELAAATVVHRAPTRPADHTLTTVGDRA